jgi:hypothetical protein
MYLLLLTGDYYSPMEHVLSNGTSSYSDARQFEALRRGKAPNRKERRHPLQPAGAVSSYSVTL